MKVARFTFLTNEQAKHNTDLTAYKHRQRTLACRRKDGTYYNVELKPKARPDDLLFSIYRRDDTKRTPKVSSLYNVYNTKLNELLETISKDEREDDGRRRKFTQYSLEDMLKVRLAMRAMAISVSGLSGIVIQSTGMLAIARKSRSLDS